MVTGYIHPGYAESFREWGIPRELPRCGGWILERPIPGSSYRDAMGCYPLFLCRDWTQLGPDLQDLGDDLVSLALVTDPFGKLKVADLRRCFNVVMPFKKHFIADLHRPVNEIISRHHRYYVRKVLENVQIDICEEPVRHIDEWVILYTSLNS